MSASNFVLYYPRIRVAYNFIPKNACSTLKATFAFANDGRSFDEVPHEMDELYREPPASLDGWTRIIVFRNPWRRLVSAYLDKMIGPELTPWRRMLTEEVFRTAGRHPEVMERLSLRQFFDWVSEQPLDQTDAHWRPQSSLVAFDEYEHRFRVETLERDWTRTGFFAKFGALRRFDHHGTSRATSMIGNELADMPGHWLCPPSAPLRQVG
ncbi:MAG: sulfotransferase family 2 domain-containing protein [Hyphomonadaceae bacterium]